MAFVEFTRSARSAASVSFVACLALIMGSILAPSPAGAATAIRFVLDRKIDGPSAPFFVAIDKGYFKDEGLDVTIDVAPGGPQEVLDRLATGKADMGVSDVNLLIKFRDANGAPIKAVFTVFDKPPYAITARRSRGIAAPRDLQGKKLGAPATDATFAQWPVFAKVAGIDAAKVAIEAVGFPVLEPMLAAGEVDAITGFSFTSYVDLKAGGVPPDDLVLLPMVDYGLQLYGDAIMAAPAFAEEKPDAVRAFLRAYAKALKDAVRDPAQAVEVLLRHGEGLGKDIELERLRMAMRDNIVTPAVQANGFGSIDPVRFAAAIDQIALAYSFKAKDKAAAAFDRSFLPRAADRRIDDAASR
jgi:NitT/TauT family transport system substrate-binding protein